MSGRLFSISSQVQQIIDRLLSGGKARRSPRRSQRNRSATEYQTLEPKNLLAGISYDAGTKTLLVEGGSGNDVATISQSGNTVTASLTGFADRSYNANSITRIRFFGRSGDDQFTNNSSEVSIAFGNSGEDILLGGSIRDAMNGGHGGDRVDGRNGDDLLRGGGASDVDVVIGGAGNDELYGGNNRTIIYGDAGNDTIFGSRFNDEIHGGSGNDRLLSNSGDDLVYGDAGDDTINTSIGDDTIFGGTGNDRIFSGAGNDTIETNGGNDIVRGDGGDDDISNAGGSDTVIFLEASNQYTIDGSSPTFTVADNDGSEGTDTTTGVSVYRFADGNETPGISAAEIVTIQPIIVANSDGSNRSEFFGTASQEADIKARINAIYDQADIAIQWNAPTFWNNTNANVGSGSVRSGNDLGTLVSQGDAGGFGSANGLVLDMYFVEKVPAYGNTSENSANGLAYVGGNGIAIHIGDSLPGFAGGREVIAEVTAHEIAHNLGLSHTNTPNNLLNETPSSPNLTNAQINAIIDSNFSRPV